MAKVKSKKILITAALPYANGPIHVGHLVEYIEADIIARFLKLTGQDAIFICASDTHGTPIEVKAKDLNTTPEAMVKRFTKEHQEDFSQFFIEFDHYYTTHSPENKELSELFFNTLNKKGHIYKKLIKVIFCSNCKRVLPDRYVKGTCPHCATLDQYGDVCESCGVALKGIDLINPACTICGRTPIQKESEHYFFKLSTFEKPLRAWLTKNKNLQDEVKNHIFEWLDKGLEDWCISRDGPYFGFQIPGEKDKYFYVWMDAPIGYISSTKHFTGRWKDYWQKDSTITHFIGKDIIYFHFLFWPAMLMGVGYTLPSDIVVHGFLTVNGQKMSKSRGTFFTAKDFLKFYNPEQLRFYYALHLSKKLSDINLDFEDFTATVNNNLVGNIANFCYRVLSFIDKNYDGKIDSIASDKMVGELDKRVRNIHKAYSDYNLKEALAEILEFSAQGNTYFQKAEPWKSKDDKATKERVGLAANMVRALSILITPILPRFSAEIQVQLSEKGLAWKDIRFNKKIRTKNVRIVLTRAEKMPEAMTFPLTLRVGKIARIRDHPNADSLYLVDVDLGKEKRQLVAGLRKYYKKEELEGKYIVVCTNIVPATIRGEKSDGMLLAADDGEHVEVLEAQKTTIGSEVHMEGTQSSQTPITFDQFVELGLKVVDRKVAWKNTHLHTPAEDIKVVGVHDGALVR
jgi:methionyl-tRNA synthetase